MARGLAVVLPWASRWRDAFVLLTHTKARPAAMTAEASAQRRGEHHSNSSQHNERTGLIMVTPPPNWIARDEFRDRVRLILEDEMPYDVDAEEYTRAAERIADALPQPAAAVPEQPTDDERDALDTVLFYSDPSGEKVFRFADPRVVSGDDTFIDQMIPTIMASAPWRDRGRGPIGTETWTAIGAALSLVHRGEDPAQAYIELRGSLEAGR